MATHRLRPDLNTATIQQAVTDAIDANYPGGDSLFSCGTVQYLLDTIKEKDHDNEVLNRVVDKLGARIIELEGRLAHVRMLLKTPSGVQINDPL